jgi:hydrogenase nickel incorporation protein HypA/HybF
VHEMAIARSIIDIAVAAAEKGNARRIVRVSVLAGELRGIIASQLALCFGLMSENTIASGAYLSLETTPAVARCRKCREDFSADGFNYVCPRCHGQDVQMVSGTELRVKDIEVE